LTFEIVVDTPAVRKGGRTGDTARRRLRGGALVSFSCEAAKGVVCQNE
jgi:hypothetical protein